LKKIAIIGSGNAGAISSLFFKTFFKDIEIDVFYDSKKQPTNVGQGSAFKLPELLYMNENHYKIFKNYNFTLKKGVLYKDWGVKNNYIWAPFFGTSHALHYDAKDLRDMCFKYSSAKIQDKKINNWDDIDADFIIDCSGKSKDSDDYINLKNPLNAVLLFEEEKKDISYTIAETTKDGWCFKIPLQDRLNCGYLFNDNISEPNIDGTLIKFSNYIHRNIFSKRGAINGYKAFFIEPMEATSLDFYLEICELSLRIIENKLSVYDASTIMLQSAFRIESFLLYHYSKGSIYNTEFWKFSKKLCDSYDFSDLLSLNYNNFGFWPKENILDWFKYH